MNYHISFHCLCRSSQEPWERHREDGWGHPESPLPILCWGHSPNLEFVIRKERQHTHKLLRYPWRSSGTTPNAHEKLWQRHSCYPPHDREGQGKVWTGGFLKMTGSRQQCGSIKGVLNHHATPQHCLGSESHPTSQGNVQWGPNPMVDLHGLMWDNGQRFFSCMLQGMGEKDGEGKKPTRNETAFEWCPV